MKQTYYEAIRPGVGGLKYYRYWVLGLHRPLLTKEAVSKALDLKLNVMRKERGVPNTTEAFNYDTLKFEDSC